MTEPVWGGSRAAPKVLKGVVMVRQFTNGFVFLLLLLVSACQTTLSPRPAGAQPGSRPSPAAEPGDRPPLKLPLVKPKIVVKKSQRQLLLFSADKLVRTYRIGLGSSPTGDKVRQGDRRTPEGDFYIFTKNERNAYYLSLEIGRASCRERVCVPV